MEPRHVELLRTVLSQPVCPFHEEAVVEQARAWAAGRGVDFSRDQAGNVLLRYRRGPARRPTWVFTAHMDHPGFLTKRQRGRSVWATFRGWVERPYMRGGPVRLFAPEGPVRATVAAIKPIGPQRWWACRLELAEAADVPPGTIGMWDFPGFRRRGTRISARGCDDLAGTVSVLCALDELAERELDANVLGLLTRAEEAGFVGALAACRLGTIPRGALVVGIETSKAMPGAPLGGGAVIRVGDRMRTFEPLLTAHISAAAERLSRQRPDLHYVRQLMPGGTCESTVYCAFAHQAAALCLPLGNYHNMGPGRRIAAERIDLDDFAALVALLVALAVGEKTPADTAAELRARLEGIWDRRNHFLRDG